MVHAWHCDANGYYSGYNNAGYDARGQPFLRGAQTCDSNGEVSFLTIYPGWYTGRATHIHFRVYLGLDLQATSQIAFPDDISDPAHVMAPYATAGLRVVGRRFPLVQYPPVREPGKLRYGSSIDGFNRKRLAPEADNCMPTMK